MSVARQSGDGPAGARLQHVLAAGYAHHHPADVGGWRDVITRSKSEGIAGEWRLVCMKCAYDFKTNQVPSH